MVPLISIVIPCRAGEGTDLTQESLLKQTFKDFEVHTVIDRHGRGAPCARNYGASFASGRYLLFSDNDICWVPEALETMLRVLQKLESFHSIDGWRVGYAYGGKLITDVPVSGTLGPAGNEPWHLENMLRRNIVDTGALMLREAFPGWDESLKRLQDWDLWLTMLRNKWRGQWVGRVLYTTPYRRTGINFEGSGISFMEARDIIRLKHNLP